MALLPATECIRQQMTMTVTGSNPISTTGRPKGMHMPSQTPPLLPKVKNYRVRNPLYFSLCFSFYYVSHFLSFPNSVSYILYLYTSKTAQPSAQPSHSILGGSLTSSRPPRPRKPRDSKPKMRKLKYHQYIPPDQRGGIGGGAGNTSQKNNNSQTPQTDTSYSQLMEQQQVFLQLQILNQQQQLNVTNR